jgi:restriction endonuclease S subunit
MKLRIQDMAEVMIGHTYRGGIEHDPNGDTSLVQSKDILGDGSVISQNLPLVKLGKTRSKAYLKKGDILLSSRGSFKAGVWEGGVMNALATSTVYVIRLNSDAVTPYFLALYLNSEAGQKEMYQYVRGAAIQALPKGNFLNIYVPVPAKSEQQIAIQIYMLGQSLAKLQARRLELNEGIVGATINKLLTQ